MQDVIKKLEQNGIEFIDIKLSDLEGKLHHITFPLSRLETAIKQGIGFDGSSLGGFRDVAESDLIVRPDLTTFTVDKFFERPTASFYGDIYEPDGSTPFAACPRNILRKALECIKKEDIADEVIVLPEFEFYLFDKAEFTLNTTASGYAVSTMEEDTTLGIRNAYHITPPADTTINIRTEMAAMIQETGIPIKYHHHEVGRFSQVEIETGFLKLQNAGDAIQTIKYIVKNLAVANDYAATFMPKPLANQAGSGMHIHFQLWKDNTNVFAPRKDDDNLSKIALQFLGGIIKHARALCALTNPSTNSYKRLMGGMEAPNRVFHSRANRKASLRVPGYVRDAKDLRFEYRVPDAMANPYLLLTGMLLAGLDGIKNNLNAGQLIVGEPAENDERFPNLPANLKEALMALKQDSLFLTKEGILPQETIDKWIKIKTAEIVDMETYPTPAEYVRYFNL